MAFTDTRFRFELAMARPDEYLTYKSVSTEIARQIACAAHNVERPALSECGYGGNEIGRENDIVECQADSAVIRFLWTSYSDNGMMGVWYLTSILDWGLPISDCGWEASTIRRAEEH
jgi:hypothetical protein